jgi:hypothetical protein
MNSLHDKENKHDEETVVLLLQVPRTNEKKELAAEQMFASLHGLLLFPPKRKFQAAQRVRISFEIAVLEKRIGFYVCVPRYLKDFVQEQLYAQYPSVQISEVPDYSAPAQDSRANCLIADMQLIANNALPIKTFQSFEVDPLAAITATLAKFEEGEEAWIQLVLQPATKNWHKKNERYVASLRGGGGQTKSVSAGGLISALWTPPEASSGGGATATKLTEYDQARASAAEDKSHKLAFEASLRIVYKGNVPAHQARLRLQSIVASYKQFNTTYLNGFEHAKISDDFLLLTQYHQRKLAKRPSVLNIEEVATLYHLPHTNVETPYILWSISQTAEPPANLPLVTDTNKDQVSPIAAANFRGHNTVFGLQRIDRSRHLYILGQTGVGKSGLLELLTIADIDSPYGFAVIDPHGDYALSVLRRIPASRAKDVIYFNPADVDFPIAFNPMEVLDPKLRTHTVSELIGVLKRMFESWGPRLEYILRYCLLALLEYPNATMLDITRILTDKPFRNEVMTYVTDPVVRNFWTIEFASWNDKFAAEAVAPVLNKVGAFTANPVVRNIIGQPKSSFNIRQIMDERKILIVNLNRGLVGEDNASLLGALLVTKIQLSAMGRADIHVNDRIPFYLYVDEFQHFATDSFATILSEARKYGLNLTVANQYIAQMAVEVKDAVFGNVGSMIAFRMGADDARGMLRYFEPRFEEYDLVHMHNRHIVLNMTISGEKTPAFSAITLELPPHDIDETENIIRNSREQYSLNLSSVEEHIRKNYGLEAGNKSSPSQARSERPNHQPKSANSIVPGEPSAPNPGPVTSAEAQAGTAQPEEAKPKTPSISRVAAVGKMAIEKQKRKRTRTRKKTNQKPVENRQQPEQTVQPKQEKPEQQAKPPGSPKHAQTTPKEEPAEPTEHIIFSR